MKIRLTFFLMAFFVCVPRLDADEVWLNNEDRITGTIVTESKDKVVLKTEAAGEIAISRAFITRIEKPDQEKSEGTKTEREVSLGYNRTRGNTDAEQLDISAKYNKNRLHADELTFKATLSTASAEGKMNAQKWYGLGRYAYNFGTSKSWYHFVRMEADHDRFANIDVRLTPATGLGYWFLDKEDAKFLLEGGLGFRHVDYHDDTKDRNEPLFTPRLFFLKKIFNRLTLTEDLTAYQSLEDNHYTLRSETSATNEISGKLALRLSFIDEFDSEPAAGKKRNDIRFLTSLVFKF